MTAWVTWKEYPEATDSFIRLIAVLNLFDVPYFAVHYKKMFHKYATDLSSGSCHVLIMILLIVSLIVMYCHTFIRMLLIVLLQKKLIKAFS